jgi:hypothetical protein
MKPKNVPLFHLQTHFTAQRFLENTIAAQVCSCLHSIDARGCTVFISCSPQDEVCGGDRQSVQGIPQVLGTILVCGVLALTSGLLERIL